MDRGHDGRNDRWIDRWWFVRDGWKQLVGWYARNKLGFNH
jgi:hypothetical protein